ncbi:MAG: FAD-binding oxidoreductase [Minicystis sp.]
MKPLPGALIAELQRCVSAPVLTSDLEVAPYGRDFGGVRRARPVAVVRSRAEEETRAVLRLLRRERVPVTIRGGGFSFDGQSLGRSVVLVNQPHAASSARVTGLTVEVPARMRWAALVDQLKLHLQMPPVLTYALQTSVGGTLSAGGYGASSVAGGAQVDHVRRLRLILPDGDARWCSPTEDADLFRFALGGMGRVGVIERVEMTTAPYRPLVRLVTREHRDAAGLLREIDALDAPDYFFAELVGGAIRSHRGYNVSAAELFALGAGEVVSPVHFTPATAEPAPDRLAHLWCDYFVDRRRLEPFLAFVERGLRDGDLAGGLDRVHILAIGPAPAAGLRAFPPTPSCATARYYGVGLFYSASEDDAQRIGAVRAAQRALLDECLRLGGRPYLCGAHALDEETIGAIYGDAHGELDRLRDRLDPDRLFNRLQHGL